MNCWELLTDEWMDGWEKSGGGKQMVVMQISCAQVVGERLLA